MTTFDEYQKVGAAFLASKRLALLADDMGLGKTAQAILAADMVNAEKILVICPAVARVNWKREFYEFSIFDRDFVVCLRTLDRPRQSAIISYDYAIANHSWLIQMQWDLVIVDEAHFLKEPDSKRTRVIYGINGIIRNTKRLWALSGTPAPNHAGELWPMLFTFGATRMQYEEFVKKFCNHKTVWYGNKPQLKIYGTLDANAPLLRHILKNVMLRRLKTDVLKELPPISYSNVVVEDNGVSGFSYDENAYIKEKRIMQESLSYSSDADSSALVLEGLANSVSTLRRINGLKKVNACIDLVSNELDNGAYYKVVVFAIHREVIERLMDGLKDYGPVVIHGGINASARQEAIDRFQNDVGCKVFIGNIIAAGTAITLTAAHNLIMLEQDWVPGNNAQAIMRCHRRGQINPVFVRFIGIEDSIDTKITNVLRRKTQQLTNIFDKGE